MPQTGSTAIAPPPTESIRRRYNRLAALPRRGRMSISPNTGGPESGPNRMKVAMVTPYWFPVRGGVTTFVADLAATLRSDRHDVRVFARDGGEPGAVALGGTGREFVRRAAGALAAFHPDVVHAHGHWYALAAGLRHRRRDPACRVIFTVHTPFPRRSWWRRTAFRLL